jgi:C_GCAxxG_C_C family probable redox protein
MTKEMLKQRCDDYFNNGKNCAQTVVLTMADYFDIQNELLADISAPFGGGIADTHVSVCGGVSGGLIIIGLVEKENKSAAGQALLKYVEENFRSCICDKILDIDFTNEEQVAAEKEPKRQSICLPMLISICEWLADRYTV